MAKPILLYNVGAGSNTAASGAGPAVPITGVAAAHTGGIASTTITLTNAPDLSGIATDGSHVLNLITPAGGRHLTRVTGKDDVADTLTVADTFTIAAVSAVDYACGGKRAGYERDTTRNDWEDAESGWHFRHEDGTYPITQEINTAAIGDLTDGGVVFEAASGASPVFDLTTTIDMFSFASGNVPEQKIIGLTFTRSVGTGTSAFIKSVASTPVFVKDCVLNGAGMQYGIELRATSGFTFINVKAIGFDQGEARGFSLGNVGRAKAMLHRCSTSLCLGSGFAVAAGVGSNTHIVFAKCLSYRNGVGIEVESAAADNLMVSLIECTIDNNTSHGVLNDNATPDPQHVFNQFACSISNNGGFGSKLSSQTANQVGMNDFNNYFNNASGARDNLAVGANDSAVDPDYNDSTAGNEDYELQIASGMINAIPDRTD